MQRLIRLLTPLQLACLMGMVDRGGLTAFQHLLHGGVTDSFVLFFLGFIHSVWKSIYSFLAQNIRDIL